jgi:pimeloyl-ACP methyl ester carboxylesterase
MFSQDEIIFPIHAVPAAGPVPPGAERLQLETPGGETLHGIHISPAEPANPPKTLILGFGGNAWNGEDVASYIHELYPGAHVVVFHYRGYRPSSGKPSADALLEDAPLVFDAAVERVRPERTIAVGFSIGSGIAASLASRRPVDGLILVTPFDSLKAVASSLYPWLPIGPFFQHEIDAAAALRGSSVPVAMVAAGRDEIIPPGRTEALRPHVPNLVFDRTIAGAGHNDIYGRDDFHAAMREALAAITRD